MAEMTDSERDTFHRLPPDRQELALAIWRAAADNPRFPLEWRVEFHNLLGEADGGVQW